jgi:DNA-binding CsgD family transcriptional regulator
MLMSITKDDKSKYLLDIIECLYNESNINNITKTLFSKLELVLSFQNACLWLIDENSWELVELFEYQSKSTSIGKYQKQLGTDIRCDKNKRWPTKINESIICLAESNDHKVSGHDGKKKLHKLSVICGLNEYPIAFIQLYREETESPYLVEDTLLLNRIAVHIAKAIAFESVVKKTDSFLDSGILVFSDDNRLLFSNNKSKLIAPDYQPEELLEMARNPNHQKNNELYCDLSIFTTQPHSLFHWINRSNTNDSLDEKLDSDWHNTVVIVRQFLLRSIIEKRLKQSQLSPRELDVALNAIQGLSNAEIASRLYIDETTVKDHLYRIYNKMSVRSRTALISRILNLDKELAGLSINQRSLCLRKIHN